jgi:hypothetical protein
MRESSFWALGFRSATIIVLFTLGKNMITMETGSQANSNALGSQIGLDWIKRRERPRKDVAFH